MGCVVPHEKREVRTENSVPVLEVMPTPHEITEPLRFEEEPVRKIV